MPIYVRLKANIYIPVTANVDKKIAEQIAADDLLQYLQKRYDVYQDDIKIVESYKGGTKKRG